MVQKRGCKWQMNARTPKNSGLRIRRSFHERWRSIWWRQGIPAEASRQGRVPSRSLWRVQAGEAVHDTLSEALQATPSAQLTAGSAVLQVKEEYMQCLKQYSNEAENCRGLAKRYLECRMSRWDAWHAALPMSSHAGRGGMPGRAAPDDACRNLMAQQDLKDLGFRDGSGKGAAPDHGSAAGSKSSDSPEHDGRRTQGFIAGLPRR